MRPQSTRRRPSVVHPPTPPLSIRRCSHHLYISSSIAPSASTSTRRHRRCLSADTLIISTSLLASHSVQRRPSAVCPPSLCQLASSSIASIPATTVRCPPAVCPPSLCQLVSSSIASIPATTVRCPPAVCPPSLCPPAFPSIASTPSASILSPYLHQHHSAIVADFYASTASASSLSPLGAPCPPVNNGHRDPVIADLKKTKCILLSTS